MKKILVAVFVCLSIAAQGQAITVKSLNRIRYVSQYLTPGQTVSQAIYNACSDATTNGTAFGRVVIEAWVPAGWSVFALAIGCSVEDQRGNGGSTQTAFNNGFSYYLRATNTKNASTLSIPSMMFLEFDPWSGGFSDILTTKTQWQAIRIQMQGRTVGERKSIESNLVCQAIGDCIGGMFSTLDFGGYSTGGDEGGAGLRGAAQQGDSGTAHGNFPTGQTTGTGGYGANYIAATWTNNSNAYLGEQKWAINTDWNVYSTGTLASGSGVSPACTLVGAGTSWTTLGTGDHTDLALEYVPYGDGTAKWIVPINHITDDTHLNVTFAIAEVGNACFNPSGAYNIYKASQIVSLAAPATGVNPTAVQLTQASANVFRVNDHIQVPFSPNFHPRGVEAIVSKFLNGPNGGGAFLGTNVGLPSLREGYRLTGNFDTGILLDSGTTMINAMVVNQPVSGAMFANFYTGSASQQIIQLQNSSLALRNWTYDRTNDWYVWNGGQYFSATDQRIGIGTTPQANTLAYHFWNNANWTGYILAPGTAAASNAKPYFGVQLVGVPLFQVEKDRTVINNGMDFKMFLDNETTPTLAVTGSNGNTSTPGTITGSRLISTVAVGTPPLAVTSTTTVPNLSAANADTLLGSTWAIPPSIGSGTPNTGNFSNLVVTSNFTVGLTGTQVKKYVEGTVVQDVASIPANTCTDTNAITVSGALDGDVVNVGVLAAVAATAGLQFTGYVSAADTAKVRICNVTTGAIDPANTTYRAGVWVH